MTVKSQSRLFLNLLGSRYYSGTFSTLLYNWPIFAGGLFFGVIALAVSALLPTPWRWLVLAGGLGVLGLLLSIVVTTFIVYDWGARHEYDRLAELGDVARANVLIDVTCGKLRGTRGLLWQYRPAHYFLIDIYDPEKMTDQALSRARALEPLPETNQRIYRRAGQVDRLPLPHNWADVIFCDLTLHEVQAAADREALFAEFARVLKPGGRLLMAEHGRDLLNLIAFGPGAFSFFAPSVWENHLVRAGLTLEHHERWRGFVHLWVATR